MKSFRKVAAVAAASTLMFSVALAAEVATETQPQAEATITDTTTATDSQIISQEVPAENSATATTAVDSTITTPAVTKPATPVVATSEEMGVTEMPSVLPGSFLYPFKQFSEWVELLFTFDPIAKADKQISLLSERLLEAKLLADSDEAEAEDLETALDEYTAEAAALEENLAEIEVEEDVDSADEIDTADSEENSEEVDSAETEDADLAALENKIAETELARQSLFEELKLDEELDAEFAAQLAEIQAESFTQAQDSLTELSSSEEAGQTFLNAFEGFDGDWQAANADFLAEIATFSAEIETEVKALQQQILEETTGMTQNILDEVNAEVGDAVKETDNLREDIMREVNSELEDTMQQTKKTIDEASHAGDAAVKDALESVRNIKITSPLDSTSTVDVEAEAVPASN
ncbi:MAG: DUF5667 domain-containing protein [Candidatus Gracilibacteria bacterium]|nr:DUF5667 domain-containing protein [Candidatus Gracilibacteria bacterium]MDD5178899.1 DUF5667 domain-containing protein [Candidatus Gracilibacteria bacterium]